LEQPRLPPPSAASLPDESISSERNLEVGLISFDIDGTLESGDPPGPITLGFIHRLRARGFIIGTCSDRTPQEQRSIWEKLGLTPDFVARKTELPLVRTQFLAPLYVHVGDTIVDQSFARQAQFDFWWPWDFEQTNPEDWPAAQE
jgi:hypothetical protein